MNPQSDEPRGYASPPCFAHELDDGVVIDAGVAPEQAGDVARWRKGERERLIARRLDMSANDRRHVADRVAEHLDHLLKKDSDTIVSLYWPFRGELNLRGWMQRLYERGARVALPVVEAKATPLTFREWTPEATLVPGVWNIPVPADGDVLDPTVVIAPLVGFDPDRFRLGYGGGFFDRTLAFLHERGLQPRVIGVGHSNLAIRTIYPQPHDVPMSLIVTEQGVFEGVTRQ